MLHSITAKSVNSNFPIAVGAKIHGVEEKSYSSTGSAYSMIVMPNQKSQGEEVLQEEDVSVAYDFAKVWLLEPTPSPCRLVLCQTISHSPVRVRSATPDILRKT